MAGYTLYSLSAVFRGTSKPASGDRTSGVSIVLIVALLLLSSLSVLHHLHSTYHH